jgi:ABC-type transport system involved in multi-copper enzyme maturation permease subunit
VTALARSEWLKIRTTRSWWAYLAVVLLLSAIAVAGEVGTAEPESRSERGFQLGLVDTVGLAALLAIILGITVVTSEFRHGTVTPTFLAEPRRERVLSAKALVAAAVSLGFALLSLLVVVAIGVPWLELVGADLHLTDDALAKRLGEQLLAAVLWGLMGVAIGALIQSQVAALVGTLLWIFLGETLIVGVLGLVDADGASAYLPFHALDAADGTGGEGLHSYWPGVAVSLGWIALLGALGTERARRRDIT